MESSKLLSTVGRFLEDTLRRKIIFFTGKGGVGKSTLCYATALACRAAGRKPLVAVWDPFESAPGAHPLDVLKVDRLRLDALTCFKEYALLTLKFEKVYDAVFDNQVLKTFIRTTPGVADGVIAGKIWDVAQRNEYDTILVDLPSTGHAFSFFKSPKGLRKVFTVGAIHRQAAQICDYFESDKTRVDFVSLPEELPLTEAKLLVSGLKEVMALNYGFFFLNQVASRFDLPSAGELPENLRPLHALYQARWKNDDAAQTIAKSFELPVISLPLEVIGDYADLIRDVAQTLESA